jgi:hypothetical protein
MMPALPRREDGAPDGRDALAARMRRARRTGDDAESAVLDAEVARQRLAPVPPFPVDAFPEPLRSAVVTGAAALGAPADFVAAGFLASLATLTGSRVRVELREGWRESACLYLAAVGEPSSKKTPALRWSLAPLHRLQAVLFADAEARAKEEADRAKGDDTDGRDGNKVPEARHVAVADITVEALYEILDANAGGVCAAWDELGGWVKSQNAYRNGFGSDREFWQAAWSGTPYYVDRKTRAENGKRLSYMLHPFVTVIGGIQPDLLLELTTTSRGRPAGRDGMLERLLFLWPDRGVTRPGAPVPDEVSTATRALFAQLEEMRFVRLDGHLEEVTESHVVPLSQDGRAAWSRVEDAHWSEQENPAVPSWWKGVAGKLHAYHARFALIIAVIREAGVPKGVSAEDIRAAGLLIDYFRATARRAWTWLYDHPVLKQYAAIMAWARRHGVVGVTVREAVRAELAGIRTADDARQAFQELAALGLGRYVTVERQGAKPAEAFLPDADPSANLSASAPGSSGSSGGSSGGSAPSEPNGEKRSTGSSGLSGTPIRGAAAGEDPGGLADAPPVPAIPCRVCGSRQWWRPRDGQWTCWVCHPPADEDRVFARHTIPPEEGAGGALATV